MDTEILNQVRDRTKQYSMYIFERHFVLQRAGVDMSVVLAAINTLIATLIPPTQEN